MSFDPVFPFAGSHAVKSAGFAVEWNIPLTDDELRQIQSLHPKLQKSLPFVGSNAALSIALNQQGPVASQGLGSVVFSRPSSAAPGSNSRGLEISKQHCVGQINDYTRWAPVWQEVRSWFETVLPALVGAHAIEAIGLQYSDVFHWRADKKLFDIRKVLREDSPYLPSNVFAAHGLWHSHHGFLTDRETPLQHKLLENINVNVTQELGQLSVVITTVHRASLESLWAWPDVANALDSLMPDLHSRNKNTLARLLNDATLKKINLESSGGNA